MLHILYLYCIYVSGYIGWMAISVCMCMCIYICITNGLYSYPRYSNRFYCMYGRKDGAVGFFRGAVPNALKVAPSSAITFLVYEECLKVLQ